MAVAGHQNLATSGQKRPARPASACLNGRAFRRYVQAVEELVASNPSQLPQRVAEQLRPLLDAAGWLPKACCQPGADGYRRHLLYGDPAGRFTVLAVVWRPGQGTPIHGHTAWGAVGVYRGHPTVATYRCSGEGSPLPVAEYDCSPGDVCHALPGTAEPHRVFNASDAVAITIHTYGRDLTVNPAAINILLEDAPH